MGKEERDPFAELMSMRQMIDRALAEDFTRPHHAGGDGLSSRLLAVDLFESADTFVVRAALPLGFEDARVSFKGETLVLTVQPGDAAAIAPGPYGVQTPSAEAREQEVNLPGPVQTDKVEVRREGRVLVVTLPKAGDSPPPRKRASRTKARGNAP